jgi:large repetitive protein
VQIHIYKINTMTKKIQLIVNAGTEDQKIYDIAQGGSINKPTRVKAVKGARYQLKDFAAKDVGPTYILSKRVGKDLHVGLYGSRDTDLIIENYYVESNASADGKGLYGMAENGDLYEYVPEDPSSKGLTSNLTDGNTAISQVLGGIPLEPTFSLASVPGLGLNFGLGSILTAAATGVAVAAASAANKKKDSPPVGVNDTATAKEASGTDNETSGTDPTGNVLANDTAPDGTTTTLVVQDVRGSGVTVTLSATTTSDGRTSIEGNFGTLKIAANGSYPPRALSSSTGTMS